MGPITIKAKYFCFSIILINLMCCSLPAHADELEKFLIQELGETKYYEYINRTNQFGGWLMSTKIYSNGAISEEFKQYSSFIVLYETVLRWSNRKNLSRESRRYAQDILNNNFTTFINVYSKILTIQRQIARKIDEYKLSEIIIKMQPIFKKILKSQELRRVFERKEGILLKRLGITESQLRNYLSVVTKLNEAQIRELKRVEKITIELLVTVKQSADVEKKNKCLRGYISIFLGLAFFAADAPVGATSVGGLSMGLGGLMLSFGVNALDG